MRKNNIIRTFAMIIVAVLAMTTLCSCYRSSDQPPDTDESTAAETEAVTTEPATETEAATETAPAESDAETEVEETKSSADLAPGEYTQGGYIIDNYAAGAVYLSKDGEEKLIYEMTRPPETEPQTDPPEDKPAYTLPEDKPTYTPPSEPFKPVIPEPPSSGGYAPSVLMYHLILDEPTTSLTGLFVRPSEFDSQIAMLKSEGYEFLFADEYTYTSGKSVMITADDGYVDNYTEMFPILKKYGVKATVFVIAGKIGWDGYLTADQIKEMSDSGLVSIQSHTVWHQSLTGLNESSIRGEFADSISILEGITGKPVRALAYPAGNYNSFVMNIAKDYFDYAYTTVSSGSTAGYGTMELPRVRVPRGMSAAGLRSQLR